MGNAQSRLVVGTNYRRKSDGVWFTLRAKFPTVMLKQDGGGPLITTTSRLTSEFDEGPAQPERQDS